MAKITRSGIYMHGFVYDDLQLATILGISDDMTRRANTDAGTFTTLAKMIEK